MSTTEKINPLHRRWAVTKMKAAARSTGSSLASDILNKLADLTEHVEDGGEIQSKFEEYLSTLPTTNEEAGTKEKK
jgi:hypothetical protein